MTLKKFIESKVLKINVILIVSFFLIIMSLIFFFIIRNERLEKSNINTFLNYLSIKTDQIFIKSEEYYNKLLEKSLNDYYNNNFPNIAYLIDDIKFKVKESEVDLKVEDINYYFINENGIIYESDYQQDIGVDISNTSLLWEKLNQIEPGEVYLDSIAEEVRTGRNRLYAYLNLDNGHYFEIGISFKNISEVYEELVKELNFRISDISIYNSYYISLFENVEPTEEMKNNFKRSIENNSIVINNGVLKDDYYYTIESDYGYKYISFTVKNDQIIIFLFFIILSFILLLVYLNTLRNRINKNINLLSNVVSDIAKDMTFFNKDSNSELNYEHTGINEIDTISKRYLDLTKEINSSFEVLKIMNEQLEGYYRNNELLIERMNKLTKIVTEFKNYKKEDEIFSEVFNLLFDFIPESDTGILIRSDEEYIRVVDAKGYEIEKINNLKIVSDKYLSLDTITIIQGNNQETRTTKYSDIPIEKYEELKSLIYRVEYSLYIPIISNYKRYGAIILNIIEKDKEFTEETIKFAHFFYEIIDLYLSTKNYGDDIRVSYKNFANKLATVAEAHDQVTGNHILRVGKLSSFIADKLGLDNEKILEIEDFAPLHDIGKIFVPSSILIKEGKLTNEEWEIMKKHTVYAKKLLEGDEKFKVALNIALYHHEKYNGTGYPNGLKEDEIPIEAQIVAVVDVYDALRSKRPYKEPYSHKKAMEIIFSDGDRTNKKHFNPNILDIIKEQENSIKDLWDSF